MFEYHYVLWRFFSSLTQFLNQDIIMMTLIYAKSYWVYLTHWKTSAICIFRQNFVWCPCLQTLWVSSIKNNPFAFQNRIFLKSSSKPVALCIHAYNSRGIFCYCCPGQFSRRENDLVTYFVTRNPDECQQKKTALLKVLETSIWDYLRVYIQSGDVSQSLLALNKWADFKVGRIHQFTTPYCFCVCFKTPGTEA